MNNESGTERDLPASAKRRLDLRNQGRVARSADATNTAILLAALLGLLYLGPLLTENIARIMQACFQDIGKSGHFRDAGIPPLPYTSLAEVLGAFLLLIIVIAISSQLLQVGIHFTMDTLEWDWSRLNPIDGLQRFFSLRRTVQTGLSLVKLIIISAFVYTAVKGMLTSPVFMRAVNVRELGIFFANIAWQIGWRILMALTTLTLIDFLYQRWQFEADSRMSFQEMKEELKQTEGSPLVKARRRRLMIRRRSLRRMIEDMSDATVVITNPTHYAVALRYVRGQTPVPMVQAKGTQLIAQRLRETALDLHIPIIENPPLARGLHKHAQVGEPIPNLYYQAVAIVLAQLFKRGFTSTKDLENSGS